MTDGLVTTKSAYDIVMTLSRLTDAIAARAMTVFAVIDHADGAKAAGMELGPTTLVIFGNARGGTPLMQKNQRAGIDLPLKALVWQNSAGVWLTVNDPAWITRRHGLDAGQSEGLAAALKALTEQAAH
ncbi:MAG TPA: DUF302 domain-containing protein [Rhizomicrobium sp.]|nr:DUF302 domain-containing protein [Rhizomicrobium sp.]